MNDDDYYRRRMGKADQMASYVLGCLFLAGMIVLGAIFWSAVS